jgi:hypothetical protein
MAANYGWANAHLTVGGQQICFPSHVGTTTWMLMVTGNGNSDGEDEGDDEDAFRLIKDAIGIML